MVALEEADIDDFEALEKYFHHSKAKKFEITQAKVWIEIARKMQYKSKELFEVMTFKYYYAFRMGPLN